MRKKAPSGPDAVIQGVGPETAAVIRRRHPLNEQGRHAIPGFGEVNLRVSSGIARVYAGGRPVTPGDLAQALGLKNL